MRLNEGTKRGMRIEMPNVCDTDIIVPLPLRTLLTHHIFKPFNILGQS